MKALVRRAVAVVTMVTSSALVTSGVAQAKTPTTLQAYRSELRVYNHTLFLINRTFFDAIASDKATELAALKAAKTPSQKYLARLDYSEARATAIYNRTVALKSLGNPPVPPVILRAATTTTTTATNLP